MGKKQVKHMEKQGNTWKKYGEKYMDNPNASPIENPLCFFHLDPWLQGSSGSGANDDFPATSDCQRVFGVVPQPMAPKILGKSAKKIRMENPSTVTRENAA